MLITFDLDDVLISNPFASGVFPFVYKVITEASGVDEPTVRSAILSEARARQRQGDFVGAYDWDDIIRKVSLKFNAPWDHDISELVERYSIAPHIALHDGAKDILIHLKNGGHSVRALTNGYYKYQFPVLLALGIADLFDKVFTPERVGWAKPQHQFFVAARQGADSIRHVHIGDHVIHDVWGANRAGATSIWINPRLPETWHRKNPSARAAVPDLSAFLKAGIEKDLCPECHPDLRLEEAKPDFVVVNLRELAAVIGSLQG